MLETRSPLGEVPRGETIVSNRGLERVQVVVERGDGSRVIRLPAPRWAVSVAVGVLGLVLVAGGAWYRDYASLSQQRAAFTALQTRLVEQQKVFDSFQERVARIRGEVDSWQVLHDRIWQPFGPDTGTERRSSAAIGGRSDAALSAQEDSATGTTEEMERLAAVVGSESQSLRALERYLAKAGRRAGGAPDTLAGARTRELRVRPPHLAVAGRAVEAHSGLDIGVPRGTPVVAPAPGIVIYAGEHAEYGVTLVIDHGNDIKTLYGHLTRVGVAPSRRSSADRSSPFTGNTGRSSGPHLHYEIQVKGWPSIHARTSGTRRAGAR